MLPPDVASGLRLILPDQQQLSHQSQTQPVTPTRQIADVLSNLVPGQRIMAEIQSLLPNGNYRATVAQRDVTLALPFSAKPGDSLELEVTENNGKLTLAFVTNRTSGGDAKANAQASVSTSISTAGKLIGDLVGGARPDGQRASAVPLNGSQPMVSAMPDTAAELAPVLKQALTQSGMFYEAHQAKWVAGKMPVEALKQEPQGKFSVGTPAAQADAINTARPESPQVATAPASTSTSTIVPTRAGEGPIPQDLVPLVRQQLDGLASNNFAWQGQIWPGQQMWWEIGENPERQQNDSPAQGKAWQSRLKLALPSLGGIDATLSLQPGGQVSLSMVATTPEAESRLRDSSGQLIEQFSAAGLHVAQLQIAHEQAKE